MAKPVPDLIEQYRVRRDAWIAQADELARLRDEVRGSAEREAMEIVTAARRDVRKVVMEARRELLVLSAQVQAALGEGGAAPDPAALLNRARVEDTEDVLQVEALPAIPDATLVSEEAVKNMLDEARADIDALVEDARTVPFQALTTATPLPLPPPPSLPVRAAVEESHVAPALSPTASRSLLSAPFPSDAVPVPSGRRMTAFVALFGVAGAAVLAGTIWWIRTPSSSSAKPTPAVTSDARATASPVAPVSKASSSLAAPAPATTPSARLSLLVEARRSSWIRTTVDGQSDTGRTYAAGETVVVTAQRSVTFRAGDAGAVYVSVNKARAIPLGGDGQVATRQFLADAASRGQDTPAAPPTQKLTEPSSGPIAAAPAPPRLPQSVPLVQSVAASPGAGIDPGPVPTVARAETVPPPAAPRPEAGTGGAVSPAAAVISASRQWLDAYQRQDRALMSALSTDGLQLADERRNDERFPNGVDVNRTLDRVSVQIAADTAVLTAVMTERAADNATPPRVSPISQVWVLNGSQWRVKQVRLVSEARLNQIFR